MKKNTWAIIINQRLRSGILALLLLVSSFSLTLTPFFSQTAAAVPANEIMNRARAWSILSAIITEGSRLDRTISNTDADKCHIFGSLDNGSVYVGHHVTGNNEGFSLGQFSGADWIQLENNPSAASAALSSVGIQGCRSLLEKIGYTQTGSAMQQPRDYNDNDAELIQKLTAATGGAATFYGGVLGRDAPPSLAYAILYYTLINVCGWQYRNPYTPGDNAPTPEGQRNREAEKNGSGGDNENAHYHTYTFEAGKAGPNTYYKQGGREDDVNVGARTGFANVSDDSVGFVDCGDNEREESVGKLLEQRKNYANEYAALVDKNDPNNPAGGSGDVKEKVTCTITGLGWILCPVVTAMASIVDGAYTFVERLLVVSPIVNNGGGLYEAWEVMRNFANVAFVIAFLIIIFSQVTSVGITNYGIKKLLPRLIVAAILVNASFWICAIAVDLSNILGGSLKSLFDTLGLQLPRTPNASAPGATANVWGAIAGAAIIATVGLWIQLSALLPILVVALFAIVTVLLVLTLRQALIILLIVISPLAFVAFLLPNTENLFKKWRTLFQVLLLMYPIIALIFGASALASQIVMATANSENADIKIIIQIMAAGISIVPLIITPLVIKTASGVLGKFAGFINNPNKGPFDKLKKGAQGVADRASQRRAIRALNPSKPGFMRGGIGGGRARRQAKKAAINTALAANVNSAQTGYVGRQALNSQRLQNQMAGGTIINPADPMALQKALASAKFNVNKVEAEEVAAHHATIDGLDEVQLNNIIADKTSTDTKVAAAMERLVQVGSMNSIQQAVDQHASSGESNVKTKSLAAALQKDGPEFLKASDIDNIARGQLGHTYTDAQTGTTGKVASSMKDMAAKNLVDGVMSPEKLVSANKDVLKYSSDIADELALSGDMRAVDKLQAAAKKVNSTPTLAGRKKHNGDSIDKLDAYGTVN